MSVDEKGVTVGTILWRGCLFLMLLPILLPLSFCGWTLWHSPRSALPKEVEWESIVAFNENSGLRDGCSFGAYRITDATVTRFSGKSNLPAGWYRTPLPLEDGQYALVGPARRRIALYADHGTTCASEKARRLKLTERYGMARNRPGRWYKILNHGEGLILVSPKDRMAWFLYFG